MRLIPLLALCLWLAVGCTRRTSESTAAPSTAVSRPTLPGVGGDAEGISGEEVFLRFSRYVPGFSCVDSGGNTIRGARETLEPTATGWVLYDTACDETAASTVPTAEVVGGVSGVLGYRDLIFEGPPHDRKFGLTLAGNASREVWCRLPDTGDVLITNTDGKLTGNLIFKAPGGDNGLIFYGPFPVTRATGGARAYSSSYAFDLRIDGTEGALSVSLDGKQLTANVSCRVAQ